MDSEIAKELLANTDVVKTDNEVVLPSCSLVGSLEAKDKKVVISNVMNLTETRKDKTDGIDKPNLITVPVITSNSGYSQDIGVSGTTTSEVSNLKQNLKKPLYADDTGPKWYQVKDSLVTRPIIPKNLPDQFHSLPIFGGPNSRQELPEFWNKKVREFVGYDLNDEEFEKLAAYCSPENATTGEELNMNLNYPTHGMKPARSKLNEKSIIDDALKVDNVKLCISRKHKMRTERDQCNVYVNKLKYRGIRFMHPQSSVDEDTPLCPSDGQSVVPGKDLIFRFRIYRPFNQMYLNKDLIKKRGRHAVFNGDILMLGRQRLSELRDHLMCTNDMGIRLDVSRNPDCVDATPSKTMFPSGFLFINNVFYVDTRAGCKDTSEPVRRWARARALGDFPCRPMDDLPLQDLHMKLGHPDVYVHQGNCEHLFTLSELRLVSARDPPLVSDYPTNLTSVTQHSLYCTTCAEFSCKWIVVDCPRVPFDPAFFCDTCFKLYMYKDGVKIGDFKAYSYKGNELNMLKPQ